MITRNLSQNCFVESGSVLRTPEAHFNQCALLTGPLAAHHSTSYGINRLSILEEIPGFSVTNGLPHDIMHDLFEGVVPCHMKLLLTHCVQEGFFTLEELNERICAFDFLKNKPSEIDSNLCRHAQSKLRQSASQMMTLCLELPLILGDKVPEDDNHWTLFLILIRICSIALAPICSPDLIAYLRVIIEEYLSSFRELYPERMLIPKQHYMIHYPSQMERFGPLIHCWTMRQESKLSFVKRVSRFSNCKNIPKTVARRHQFWLCHQIVSNPSILTPQLESSPKHFSSTLACEDDYIQCELKRAIPTLNDDSVVCHPDWVKLQGSRFVKGLYILIKFNTVNPVFGKIVDLVTLNQDTLFISVLEYVGKAFCPHYKAFLIKSKSVISAHDVNSLTDHRPFYARSLFSSTNNEYYISLPYYY